MSLVVATSSSSHSSRLPLIMPKLVTMQVVVHTSIDLLPPPTPRAEAVDDGDDEDEDDDDDDDDDDDVGGGRSNLAISRGRADGMYHAFDAIIVILLIFAAGAKELGR